MGVINVIVFIVYKCNFLFQDETWPYIHCTCIKFGKKDRRVFCVAFTADIGIKADARELMVQFKCSSSREQQRVEELQVEYKTKPNCIINTNTWINIQQPYDLDALLSKFKALFACTPSLTSAYLYFASNVKHFLKLTMV